MRISKSQFWLVTLLFLLLPFSIHWKLLLFGKRAEAIVVEQLTSNSKNVHNTIQGSTFTILQFTANNKTYRFSAPEDVKYDVGKKIKIIYNKDNPEKFLMLNFAGLVLGKKMILPGVLLIMWFSFYAAMSTARK